MHEGYQRHAAQIEIGREQVRAKVSSSLRSEMLYGSQPSMYAPIERLRGAAMMPARSERRDAGGGREFNVLRYQEASEVHAQLATAAGNLVGRPPPSAHRVRAA